MDSTQKSGTCLGFQERATEVGSTLRESLQIVLETAAPEAVQRSIHASVRSRLARALREEEPLATLFHLPGVEALRDVVEAGRVGEADAGAIERSIRGIEGYEALLREEGASRETLQTILGQFLPEARLATLRSAAQGAFRSMSQLAGYSAQAHVGIGIFLPGSTPERHTFVCITGVEGWQCLRSDVWGYITARPGGGTETTLDGVPLGHVEGLPLLPEFCSRPTPRFVPMDGSGGAGAYYRLESSEVGARSTCTWFSGVRLENAGERCSSARVDTGVFSITCINPSQAMLLDVLIHRDLWSEIRPIAEVYRIVPRGRVQAEREDDFEARRMDRVVDVPEVRRLAQGLVGYEKGGGRRLRPVMESVLARLGHQREQFHGFRMELDYPVYGHQYMIRFPLPVRSEGT